MLIERAHFENKSYLQIALNCFPGFKAKEEGTLTTGNVISIGSQSNKVLFVDVSFESAQTVRFTDIPELQLTVC